MHSAWHIGITGGIGSGKSAVATMLSTYGAAIIDADAISRSCTAANGAATAAIRTAFGPAYLDEKNAVNRTAMRERIFGDPLARKQLQEIIHPIVVTQMLQQGQKALGRRKFFLLYDIPLLAESTHWRSRLHQVIVVDCDEETQIRRTMLRSQLDKGTITNIIATQASRQARLAIADTVIDNTAHTSWQTLQHQVQQLAAIFGLIKE